MVFYKTLYGRYVVANRQGLRLLFDLHNSMDKWTLALGDYEREQRLALFGRTHLEAQKGAQPMIFIDVGAHWGWYALLAWRENVFAHVICFEADPTNYDQLRANLFLNRCYGKIEAVQAIVSDTETPQTFQSARGAHRSTAKVISDAGGNDLSLISVRSVTLGTLPGLGGHTIFMKIDVEGHELAVLNGARNLITHQSCILQVEIFERNYPAVEALLTEMGYRSFGRIGDDHFFERSLA